MQSISDLRRYFYQYKNKFENETSEKLKTLKCDNAKEYRAMKELLNQEIIIKFTTVYTPEQNGAAEKVRLKADRAIEATPNMTLRIKQGSRRARAPISNKTERTCYRCEKPDHLIRDCPDFSDEESKRPRRKRRETEGEDKRRSKKLNKVANKESSSDEKVEAFKPGKINMTAYKGSRDENKWYIGSCASGHITNQRHLFKKMRQCYREFELADGSILISHE